MALKKMKKYIVGAVIVLGICGYFYTSGDLNKDSISSALNKTNLFTSTVKVSLPVTVLKTSYGIDQATQYQYPALLKVMIPKKFSDQVEAYGAAEEVIVAPKGWIGQGISYADGTRQIVLESKGGVWGNNAKLKLYIPTPGTGNALFCAVPYFPWVKMTWDTRMGIPIPPTPKIIGTFVTKDLLKYHLKNPPKGLMVAGVVFSNNHDYACAQLEITYPSDQQDFVDELLNIFVQQYGLSGSSPAL